MGRVLFAVHVRTAGETVDVDEDAGVAVGVDAGNTDGRAGLGGTAAREVELSARGVELHAVLAVGGVESGDLDAQEVLAVGDAGRELEVDPAVVLDQVVDAPDRGRGIERVLPDFEPLGALRVGACRVIDLGHVRGDGSLVRRRNRVVRVVGELGSADDVLVPRANLITGLDVNDLIGGRAGSAARQRGARRILHRVVVCGGTETDERALVSPVHREFLVPC